MKCKSCHEWELPELDAPAFLLKKISEIFGMSGGQGKKPAERKEAKTMTINKHGIRKASGMTQAEMSMRYMIPLRTVENWDMGVRVHPDYVKIFLAKAIGMM